MKTRITVEAGDSVTEVRVTQPGVAKEHVRELSGGEGYTFELAPGSTVTVGRAYAAGATVQDDGTDNDTSETPGDADGLPPVQDGTNPDEAEGETGEEAVTARQGRKGR